MVLDFRFGASIIVKQKLKVVKMGSGKDPTWSEETFDPRWSDASVERKEKLCMPLGGRAGIQKETLLFSLTRESGRK